MVQSPEAPADPVHQIPLLLPGEFDRGAVLLDGGRQLGAGVRLIFDEIADEHQAHIIRQIRKEGGERLLVPGGSLEEVVIVHQDHRAFAHHRQAVHRLLQPLGIAFLGLKGVEVELLHTGGEQLFFHLPQVEVPKIGLLPVKDIEPSQSARRDVLFELLECRRIGGGYLCCHARPPDSPGSRTHGDGDISL